MKVYLDHAATTPCDERVIAATQPFFGRYYGNASSQHWQGEVARAAVEAARGQVADLIGANAKEIVFTSSGTEANNAALKGVVWGRRDKGNHIITSAIEHHSVLETAKFLEKEGFEVTYLPVDEYGMVSPKDVEKAITERTVLVSVMHANNEVGTIQPIEEIGRLTRARKVYFHTDAVQTVGSVPVDVEKFSADLLSLSAHKLYGPKGVGALYVRKGVFLQSLLHGGDQEGGRRAGTENVAGIVGLGEAARLALQWLKEGAHLEALRDRLIKGILSGASGIKLNGHPVRRLPGNVNVSVEYIEGESMVLHLDAAGIAASSGSACSSTDLKPSHVLLAMGLSHELAHGSLRLSLGKDTSEAEIDRVITVLPGVIGKLRAMSPLAAKKEVVRV